MLSVDGGSDGASDGDADGDADGTDTVALSVDGAGWRLGRRC